MAMLVSNAEVLALIPAPFKAQLTAIGGCWQLDFLVQIPCFA